MKNNIVIKINNSIKQDLEVIMKDEKKNYFYETLEILIKNYKNYKKIIEENNNLKKLNEENNKKIIDNNKKIEELLSENNNFKTKIKNKKNLNESYIIFEKTFKKFLENKNLNFSKKLFLI